MDPEAEDYPEELYCPITQTLMEDPVITVDGHTYERELIETWFQQGKNTSPLTNLPLNNLMLIPNLALKKLICSMKENKRYGVKFERKKMYKEIVVELSKMWDSKIKI